MGRVLSIKNAYSKVFDYMPFEGIWAKVLGKQTRSGAWIIYGAEKHGKTTFALMLANYLSSLEKVLYISAEEDVEDTFISTCQRVDISEENTTLKLWDYMSIAKVRQRLEKRRTERIVFIDNISVYVDELKGGVILDLIKKHKNTLFIFLAHEKDGEPYTATAQACKRFAKVIIQIEGLTAKISGRCPGGTVVINEEKAALIYGDEINKTNIKED